MNRGEIPGYYYDAEKKKYFAIQKNQNAASNSKYSRASVNEAERQLKKQKLDIARDATRRKQTVTRAKPFENPLLASCGIYRELGSGWRANIFQRDHALVGSMETRNVVDEELHSSPRGSQTTLADAQYLPLTKHLVALATGDGMGALLYGWGNTAAMSETENLKDAIQYHRLPNDISKLTTATYSCKSFAVAACPSSQRQSQLFLTTLNEDNPDATDEEQLYHSEILMSLGTSEASDAREALLHPIDPHFVLGTNRSASIWDLYSAKPVQSLANRYENDHLMAIEWLQQNVLMTARSRTPPILPSKKHNPNSDPRNQNHKIHLFDIRSSGSALRLNPTVRTTNLTRLTTITLLIANNRTIDYHDLRMISPLARPVFSIPHTSAGAKTEMSVYTPGMTYSGSGSTEFLESLSTSTIPASEDGRGASAAGILAAVDERGGLKMYSLGASGRRLHGLLDSEMPAPWDGDGTRMRNPRWYEDARGAPYLQVCQGNVVKCWSWNGGGLSEEEETDGEGDGI